MAQEPQKGNSIGIIIAVITAIGVVTAALIAANGNNNVEKMRQQAELTQIALISQLTQAASQGAVNVPTVSVTSTTIASPAPTLLPVSSSTLSANTADINQVCQSLSGIIPNSPEEVRAKFGIPADKGITVFYELCQEAPNGFGTEETPSLFTLEVPSGGCIDSYSGAQFSEATVLEELFGGRRAYSGTVTTTSLTYRIAGCELKP